MRVSEFRGKGFVSTRTRTDLNVGNFWDIAVNPETLLDAVACRQLKHAAYSYKHLIKEEKEAPMVAFVHCYHESTRESLLWCGRSPSRLQQETPNPKPRYRTEPGKPKRL